MKRVKNKIKIYFSIVYYLVRHPRRFYHALSTRGKKWALRGLILLLIILTVVPASFWYQARHAKAAWWDDSWMYREAIPVTNNTTQETNVYISVTVDSSDTSKFQTDCGDIRFTKRNGEILAYFIVSGCGTASTVVHVNFDVFPAGAQTLYMYYGNPSAQNGFAASDFSTVASNYTVGTLGTEEIGPGPVAYWKFDEGQGTTAQDSSSSNFDGSFSGAPVWKQENECVSGKCLSFDGSDDRIIVADPTNGGLDFGTTKSFTISTWINLASPSSRQYNGIIGKCGQDNSCAGYELFTGNNGGYVSLRLTWIGGPQYGTSVSGTFNFADNKYHHVVAIVNRSNNTAYLYIDGSQINSGDISSVGSLDNTQALTIGYNGASFFKGYIDESKIFPYARSADQIKQDYNAGLAAQSSNSGSSVVIGSDSPKWMSDGLVGHWKMDETSWNGTAGEVVDASGNGNNGTAAGGAATAAGKFGNGGSFDGTDDSINLTSAITLSGEFSISTWFNKADSLALRTLISKNAGSDRKIFFNTDNTLGVRTVSGLEYKNIGYDSSMDGYWHYLAIVRDSSGFVRVNLDGGSPTIYSAQVGDAIWEVIGRTPPDNQNWKGKLDDVRIYNRALSPAEVKQLFEWAPGPVGDWKMDEASWNGTSGEVKDSSGYGNNGTRGGNATTASGGKFDRTGIYDGSGDNIQIPASANFDTQGLTISSWNYSDNYDRNMFMFEKTTNGTVNTQYSLFFNSGGNNSQIYFRTYGLSTTDLYVTDSLNGPVNNQWNHIVATYDPATGTKKIFCNGKEIASVSGLTGTLVTNPAGTSWVGAYGGGTGYPFNGKIDETRVYNYARTQKQIQQDMQGEVAAATNTASGPVPDPIAYWKFNEGQGNNFYDSGPNNLTLTNSGTTWSNEGKFGKALDFTNDAVSVADNDALDFGTGDFSVSFWAYHRDYTYPKSVVSMQKSVNAYVDGNPGWEIGNSYSASGYQVALNDGTHKYSSAMTMDTGSRPTDIQNRWAHIMFVFSRSTGKIKLYVNGVKQAAEADISAVTGSINNSSGFKIGQVSGWQIDGLVDEVKMYRAALSDDQVKQDMNQGKSMVMGSAGSLPNDLYGAWTYYQDPARADVVDAGMHWVLLKSSSWCGRFPATITEAGKYRLTFEYSGTGTLYIDNDGINDNTWNNNMAATSDWQTYTSEKDFTTTGSHSMYFRTSGSNINVRHVKIQNISKSTNAASQDYCVPGDATSCAGPTGEWELDDGTGGTAVDTSGVGNNGTVTGATLDRGKVGKGLSFDADNENIDTGKTLVNFMSASAGTVEAWIKPMGSPVTADAAYQLPAAVSDYCCAGGYMGITRGNLTGVGDGIYVFGYSGGTNYVRIADYTVGEWVHIAWVHSGGYLYAYKNGQLVGSVACGSIGTGYNFRIGDAGTNTGFTGSVDQVRTFNYARTAAQIAWDVNRGGPVGWWKMDEAEGDQAHDWSGNLNTGTLTSMDPPNDWVAGKFGNALDFDGSNDYVNVPDNDILDLSNSSLSFSFWIKPVAWSSNDSPISKKTDDSSDGYVVYYDGNQTDKINLRIKGASGNNTYLYSTSNVDNGVWQNWIVTYDKDAQTVKWYKNGALDKTYNSISVGTMTNTAPLHFGHSQTWGGYSDGQLDDVRIYNYALTAEQVKQVMNGGAAVRYGE